MATTNYYEFLDRFEAPCDIETAWSYISQPENYPKWWGKVYKEAIKTVAENGDETVKVVVGGFLPYTLTIFNRNTLKKKPFELHFDAWGDLQGKGIWLLETLPNGNTQVTFDWRVAADKAVIRWFSWMLKPLFRANHNFCIVEAEKGLRADLSKRTVSV
ncbi:MAG: SRPBCC family protein [Bacteroidota bacterium]